MNKNDLKLYFIAGTQDLFGQINAPNALLILLEKSLIAGISCFQLREKGNNSLQNLASIEGLARNCKDLCNNYGVPFFINDDVDLALRIRADGIHVGQGDTPIKKVINKCQGRLVIGLSINTLRQAQVANLSHEIYYFGVGPIFPTTSKPDAKAVVGTKLISKIRDVGIDKPLLGIGGISTANAVSVIKSGADGVAVISAITKSSNLLKDIKTLKLTL